MKSHVAFLALACAVVSLFAGCVSASVENIQGVYAGVVTNDRNRVWKVILAWDGTFLADLESKGAKSTQGEDGIWHLPVPEKHLEGTWRLSSEGDHLYLSRNGGDEDVFSVKIKAGLITLEPERSDLPTLIFQNELKV